MSNSGQKEIRTSPLPIRKFICLFFQLLLVLAVLGGLLFIPAGRLDWMDARDFAGAYGIFLLALFIVCGLDTGRFRWSSIPAPAKRPKTTGG